MDYKEKYEMALEGIQEILGSGEDSIKMSRLQLRLQGIFPELKESEDEKIRKAIHIYLDWLDGRNKYYHPKGVYTINDMIDWIEKQGKHQKFRDSIQVGDKVTRNEDGVLVNLSQLNRVAKKQGKQETLCDKCRKEQPSASCQDITALGRCAVEHEQNPAWSEEDEKMFEHIIAKATLHFSSINYLDEEEINFLKSLKPQNTWKPSDEQMYALEKECIAHSNYELCRLLEQLKKLREE